MKPLRIFIADDHEIVRHGLIALVESQPGWEVCGEATNGRIAVDKVKELRPDIAILDIGMPIINGIEATRRILEHNASVKVLILTMADGDRVVRDSFEAGARGFLLKSDASRDLVVAIQALQFSNTFFTARASEIVLAGYLEFVKGAKGGESVPGLSPREREVVQLVAEGKSTKETALYLGISCKTAETHRSNIMRKLKIHSVGELVLFAVRNGIIQIFANEPASRAGKQVA
jgi:DNA-binding NarL/FixJ family response regulator